MNENDSNNNDNSNKNRKIKDALTTSLSIAAFIISIFVAVITHKEFSLIKQQDEDSKTAIWIGEYEKETQDLKLKSINDNIFLQSATIYFPGTFNINPIDINSSTHSFSTIVLESEIMKFVEEKIEKDKDSHIVTEADIPIVIYSEYVTGGKSYTVTSGYSVRYIAAIFSENQHPTTVELQGLLYSHHVPLNQTNFQQYLNNYWNAIYSSGEKSY